MTSQLFWYTARASGLVGWGLLAASVLWGLALSTRVLGSRPRPNWLLDLHRFVGAAAVVFVGVHVASLVADSYVHFGPTEILLPLASKWHPVAVAWGIISMYLLLAVEVTSLLRRRLSRRLWRATHFLSFPLFATATVHLLFAGTERHNNLLRLVVAAVVVAVAVLTAVRVRASRRAAAAPPAPRVPPGLRQVPRSGAPRPARAQARPDMAQPRPASTSPVGSWPTTPPPWPPPAETPLSGAGSPRS